jgi:putative ABC transport system permease protein
VLKISLRSLASHKLRLALTATAVVLGVAFVSGMLLLTGALNRTFTDIFASSAQDVLVQPRPAIDTAPGPEGAAAPLLLDDGVVARVAATPGVAAAAGGINTNGVYLLDSAGEVVGAVGPPALGVSWSDDPALSAARIVEGAPPVADLDIVVDRDTFPRLGVALGGPVTVLTPRGEVVTTLVGTFQFGDTGGLAGATLTAFRPDTAQRLFAEPGTWQFVDVATAAGSSDQEVADALRTELGPDFVVQTRAEQVEASSSALQDGLGFLNTILLGFAGIALFVAAFLIFNTFSMLIAQRSKEMALLRAVGASQRQVLRSVLLEALLLGVFAAALGELLGIGLALALKAGVGALGLELSAGISPTAGGIGLALGLGVAVTVLSAVAPALRASRILPVEALRESQQQPDRPGRLRSALGLLVAAGAGAAILLPLRQDEPAAGTVALGAMLLLVAGILLAPLLAQGFTAVAAPLTAALGGTAGRLAGRNAGRSPRRVAATASALIVGLSLVTGVTVITASARESINALVDRSFGAELVVATPTGAPFATSIGDAVAEVPGIDHVVRQGGGPAELAGEPIAVTALGGGPISSVITVDTVAGDLAAFGPGRVVVDEDFAEQQGLAAGDEAVLRFPSGQESALEVVGVFAPTPLLFGLVMDLDDFRSVGGAAQDTVLLIDLADGADPADVLPAVEEAVAANPLLVVSDQSTIKEQNSRQLNQLLYLIYAMLGLSIIIAALGVVNTMVLSVVERTREIGMLRAIGASQRQVRRMVRWEAVLVSLVGGVVGVALGTVGGVALQRALAGQGIDRLALPLGTIAALLLAALAIGLLGAIFPARRAARLDILRAVVTD